MKVRAVRPRAVGRATVAVVTAIVTSASLTTPAHTFAQPTAPRPVAPQPVDAQAAKPPRTVPALQKWTAGGGAYTFTKTSRLVIDKAAEVKLTADAATFAEDLQAQTTIKPTVVSGAAANLRPGDVFLQLGAADKQLGYEGYQLKIGPSISIRASTAAGAFNGTRTVLQMLRTSKTIPGGVARDWPAYPIRSVTLHNAPRTAGMAWYRNQVREVSYLKMNEIMIFAQWNKYAADLQKFASRYHIRVLPHINMPGHMDSLAQHPEWQLADKNGKKYKEALDLTIPAARAYALKKITDHIGGFSGAYWHAGADEYPAYKVPLGDFPKLANYAKKKYGPNATAVDTVKEFINEVDDLIHKKGKSLRIWNDMTFQSKAVQLHPGILVEHWSSREKPQTPQQLADAGHSIVNANRDFLFYFGGKNPDGTPRPKTDPQKLYEHFNVGQFQGGQRLDPKNPKLAGLRLSVWNSEIKPDSDASLEAGTFDTYRVIAQLGWGSPRLVKTWAELKPIVTKLGRAPGFVPTKE